MIHVKLTFVPHWVVLQVEIIILSVYKAVVSVNFCPNHRFYTCHHRTNPNLKMAEIMLPSKILNFVIDSRIQLTSSGINNIISIAVKRKKF